MNIHYRGALSIVAASCISIAIYAASAPAAISTPLATSTEKKATAATPLNRCTITNTIKKKDTGYSYMMGMRYPNAFSIEVDGKKIEPGASITTENKTITVSCRYEWKAPWKTYASCKKKEYTIAPGTTDLAIAFDDWNSENKIKILEKKQLSDKKR